MWALIQRYPSREILVHSLVHKCISCKFPCKSWSYNPYVHGWVRECMCMCSKARQVTCKWEWKYKNSVFGACANKLECLCKSCASVWLGVLMCKYIQIGLSSDKCSHRLAVQSRANTHPFSGPVFWCKGTNGHFWSGSGKQGQGGLGGQPLDAASGNFQDPPCKRSEVTQLTPQRGTALAQVCTSLTKKVPN